MEGYYFKNQPTQSLKARAVCSHCKNEGEISLSIPASLSVIMRANLQNVDACDRCFDAAAVSFRPGYNFRSSELSFPERFDAWIQYRAENG